MNTTNNGDAWVATARSAEAPIDMVLHCPACGLQHIDAPDHVDDRLDCDKANDMVSAKWDNPPHRSHLCHDCGHIWRPADVPTNGVQAVKTRGKADSALATHPDNPQVEAESRCANCGKPASGAEKVISEYPEEGEWFCSDECHDQHSELGCPHERHDGYRHPAEARRLIECEEALRSLASWLGVGGYNAPAVDAKKFEAKIRDGVEHIQTRPRSAAEGYLAMWGPLLARAQAEVGGVAEAALRELIEARDAFAASALAEDRAGCLVGAQEQIDKHLQADMRLKFAWIAARDAITPAPQAREGQS